MRETTRTLGIGLLALVLAVSAGFAGIGAMASGGTTTSTNQSAVANQTTVAQTSTVVNQTTAANQTTVTDQTTVANRTTTANQTTTAKRTTTAEGAGTAQVRIAHMSPDAPPVDVLVDGQTVVSNLSYGNVTDYTSLSAGEHNVTIAAASDPSTVVFSGNETFSADTNYTVTATGLLSESGDTGFEPVVYEDNFTAPDQGNASVRLIHVSPDTGPVDVTVQETNATLFDNVSFREATAYEQVPAGNYTLEVRPATANDSGRVLETFDVSLNDGTVYSAFAAGYSNPSDVPAGSPDRPFELILVTDFTATRNVTTVAPTTAPPQTTTANQTTAPPQTTTRANATTAAPQTTWTSVNVTTSANRTTAKEVVNATTPRTNTSQKMQTETSTAERTTKRTNTSENVTRTSTSEDVTTTSTIARPNTTSASE